jgi:molecular chaperone GrpE
MSPETEAGDGAGTPGPASDPAEDETEATAAADAERTDAEAAEPIELDIESLLSERDQFKDIALRLQADFENYRKRVMKQQAELAERAAEGLVGELLPVLDACDAAAQHGDEAVAPIAKALVDVLTKQGLEKVAPEGEAFDPNQHEAVAHEPAEGDGGPTVAEVLRPGYVWKGRVLRPAMVRVRG